MKRIGLFSALCALALAVVGVGCDDTTTGDTTSSSSGTAGSGGEAGSGGTGGMGGAGGGTGGQGGGMMVMPGTVDVTVEYAGTQTGTLRIAAFTQWPPMSLPSALAQNSSPMFPQTATLTDLAPGTYFVTAILDIGDNNPMSPGPEDLQTVTMPAIEVMENMATPVTVTLVDKP